MDVSNAEKIIKNIFVIGFFIGIGIGVYFLVKFFNSPAGQLINQLFGGIATMIEGLAAAMNFMTGLFNNCTQGKNNDGSSVSTTKQATSCLSMIGIVIGVLFGVPLIMAGAKTLYNKLRPGSENMKEMEETMKENIKNALDTDSETYSTRIEAIKENLKKTGKYDENTEEGKAKLNTDAERIYKSSVDKIASEKLAQRAKDIAAKSKNESDQSSAKEAQTKAEAKEQAQIKEQGAIEKENDMDQGELDDTVQDADDDVAKEFSDDEK
jgi:hypothetical protein